MPQAMENLTASFLESGAFPRSSPSDSYLDHLVVPSIRQQGDAEGLPWLL